MPIFCLQKDLRLRRSTRAREIYLFGFLNAAIIDSDALYLSQVFVFFGNVR